MMRLRWLLLMQLLSDIRISYLEFKIKRIDRKLARVNRNIMITNDEYLKAGFPAPYPDYGRLREE